MPPSVSICLVTYNRDKLLPLTIDSLLRQSYGDFELIISDDASTDGTERICRDYAKSDRRIRYIRNTRNLGMPGNLNSSLQAATGRYLANLHDGDTYREDLIARWKLALDSHPTAGFVFNAYKSIDKGGNHIIYRETYPALIPGWKLGIRLLSRWDSCVYGTVMTRREVYEKIGWFDPAFANFADVDMWLRIASEYDAAYVDETLIDLMPKDPARFYAFVHWQVLFWIFAIHRENLRRYSHLSLAAISGLISTFPARKRRRFMYQFLICVKHRRWDRVREALAIWSDADDPFLRAMGRLGRHSDKPGWYKPTIWDSIRLEAGR